MRILIDAMGGDNAPIDIVKGTIDALEVLEEDITITLVGRQQDIEKILKDEGYEGSNIEIRHAEDVIENEEAPVRAIRRKKDSSMVVAMTMLKEGEGDVFISAGSTGAILAGSLFVIGRIEGIDRPTLAALYPMLGGRPSMLVDAGANTDCRPNNLLEFAAMGGIYYEKVIGVENPTVGLVNIGEEDTKGNTLTKETHKLLKKSNMNFIGNIEGREVPRGGADIIVCDGFTGNVILKLTEGLALNIMALLKNKFTKNIKTKIGASFLKREIIGLKSEFDYTEYGGAPILGVKKPVVKMHGSSNANAVKNTILKAIPFVREDVVNVIESAVLELKEIEDNEI